MCVTRVSQAQQSSVSRMHETGVTIDLDSTQTKLTSNYLKQCHVQRAKLEKKKEKKIAISFKLGNDATSNHGIS